jgi:hypothetical protein
LRAFALLIGAGRRVRCPTFLEHAGAVGQGVRCIFVLVF